MRTVPLKLVPTLVTPAPVLPVTLDELKKSVGAADFSDDDALLMALAEAAVSHLDGWSGRLGRCMLNQVWRFPWRQWPSSVGVVPLCDVSAVSVRYRDGADIEQTLPAQQFRFFPVATGTAIEWTSAFQSPTIFDRTDAIGVEVTAGYGPQPSSVPRALRTAVIMLAATWYERREATSESGEQELPFRVRQIIAPFRRNTV